MRKNIIILLMPLLCTLCFVANGQDSEPDSRKPQWISDEGYWQIVTHVKTPKTSVVQFYNNDNVLIYSEKVEGVRLNIKKRQTCMRLKKALELALADFEKKQQLKDEGLVKNILRTHK